MKEVRKKYSQMIDVAKDKFRLKLKDMAPIELTEKQYIEGINSLPKDWKVICAAITKEISEEQGYSLTDTQLNLAFLAVAEEELNLIEYID